eukprot:gnl/MRDRNA2_/MRDRNA2_90692_c0_seq1.p1 gnl/MRDRNA2_/MRDRNA2_90692_c0~~gnl/MRDRNA2_/MRDRNA2_90692_c0_seq1.p1  ORF type:complete len:589 (-),score=105.38 gnl/MRDRNA2_/MRDRNA2_90692_c0_seq1:3-1769(-)
MKVLLVLLGPFSTVAVEDVGLRGLQANLWSVLASEEKFSKRLRVSELETHHRELSKDKFVEDPQEAASRQIASAKEMLAKGFDQLRQQLKQNTIFLAVVCVSLLLLAACSLRGFGKGSNGTRAQLDSFESAEPLGRDLVAQESSDKSIDKPQKLSMFSIMLLTCFKFYVGFLAATWMPFLMAKEGLAIWPEKQSVFMGAGKLIYGTSILLNPVIGLISDQTVFASRWSGRRLWLIVGVAISSIGIATVKAASSFEDPTSYLVATALWMLGEAIADTTTETLVPEMVPAEQYDVASGIRSLMFLCGGLFGYVTLIIFRDWDFHWLYPGYLLLLLFCAFPTVASIREEEKSKVAITEQKSILASIFEAYTGPMHKYGPSFARACVIQFVFSLGVSSIFFTMLMVRDVVGVVGQAEQQTHFSAVSMLFMLAAALSSVVAAWLAANLHELQCGGLRISRLTFLLSSMALFGVATLMVPVTYHLHGLSTRLCWFYTAGILMGTAFGSVYALFQSCMWKLLPENASDVANAMGFAALCKCVGIGLGNFAAGFILDAFSVSTHEYAIGGYWAVAVTCCVLVLTSVGLGHGVEGLN